MIGGVGEVDFLRAASIPAMGLLDLAVERCECSELSPVCEVYCVGSSPFTGNEAVVEAINQLSCMRIVGIAQVALGAC